MAQCTRKIMAREMIELKREELLACSQSLFDQPQSTEKPRSRHNEEWIHPRGDEQGRRRCGEYDRRPPMVGGARNDQSARLVN